MIKSRGIVLRSIKYSETSLIVKIYTDTHGIRSFLVKGVRKSKTGNGPGLFQPLNLLEIIYHEKQSAALIIPREVNHCVHFVSIPFNIDKSSIALFMNEIIIKAAREEEANEELFLFLWDQIVLLDETENSTSNFHIYFTLQLTRYLGFHPLGAFSAEKPHFFMKEGFFGKAIVSEQLILDSGLSELFSFFLYAGQQEAIMATISSSMRKLLLEKIILYYQLHLNGFGEIKSLEVLTQVFHS